MGTASEFMITPYGSLIVGFCSGIVTTLGYLFLTVSFALLYSTEIAHIEVKETLIMYLFKMWMFLNVSIYCIMQSNILKLI